MAEPFRQGSIHRPLRATVFTEAGVVNLVTEFPNGITFRMVHGVTVIAGEATGDTRGNVTYQWQTGDLDLAGTYQACFIGTDAIGRTETFPSGTNLEIVVIPAI